MNEETTMDLIEEVYLAIGQASTCWTDLGNAGVFDSGRATTIAEDLIGKITAYIEIKKGN